MSKIINKARESEKVYRIPVVVERNSFTEMDISTLPHVVDYQSPRERVVDYRTAYAIKSTRAS